MSRKKKTEAVEETIETPEVIEVDRDVLYDRYAQEQGIMEAAEPETTELPPTEEVTGEEIKVEEKPEQKEETPKEEYAAPTVTPPVEEEKKEKLVPYDALHAERERRKAMQKELDEAKVREHQLLQDIKKATTNEPAADDDEIVLRKDYKQMQAENAILQGKINQLEQRLDNEDQNRAIGTLEQKIQVVDKELTDQGYPGFTAIGREMVVKRLNSIAVSNGQEEAAIYDNPEGWKQIYIEEFGKIQNLFKNKQKDEVFDKKRQLKESANLSSSVGKKEPEKKESDEWTWNDYLKMRKDAQII